MGTALCPLLAGMAYLGYCTCMLGLDEFCEEMLPLGACLKLEKLTLNKGYQGQSLRDKLSKYLGILLL